MGTFSIGGLSSGLDTKSIISQLLEIDARPKVRKQWQHALWTERKNIWSEVNTRLLALQGKASALNNPASWSVSGITSSDPSKLTAAAGGPSPAAGTYTINITQLAANEVWDAANSVGAAVGGARQSGTWYAGSFTPAGAGTLLTNLTSTGGMPTGLDVGSTISLSATVNGSPVSGNFTVNAGSTLNDLVQWAESNFPGATFTVNGDGTVSYQSAAGATNEITSLSFTATNSGGSPLAVFNGSDGASSSFVAPPTGGTAAADTLTITQGASVWNVAIGAGSDDAAIAAAINGTAGIGVNASVVAGKLQLTSNVDGAAGDFTVTSAGTLVGDLGLAETTNGQDAIFDVDGTGYTRSSNVVSDVISDVDLNLLGVTGSALTLTVSNGTVPVDDLKNKIKSFVEAYNSVIDYVNAKTGEQKVANPKTLNDFLKGPLARDFGLSGVGFDIRKWATDTVSGLPGTMDALDDIGITTGDVVPTYSQANTAGRLYIDETKLDAALASDPAAVKAMFTTVGGAAGFGDDGISRRISDLVTSLRSGGRVDAAMQGAGRQVTELQRTIDRMDDRLERKRLQYEKMFASLETTLGKIQQQNAWLSGQFAALANQGMQF